MEQRYNCAKRYHVLLINCAKGIIFGLVSVLNVIIFLLICNLLSSITSINMALGDVICKLWLPHVNKAVSTEGGTKSTWNIM